jgi:hypothetical protein
VTKMAHNDTSVDFDFYGLKLQVQGDDEETVDDMRRDFSYFEVPPGPAQVTIEVFNRRPPFDSLPNLSASFYSTRNICYRGKESIYADYFGRALTIFNPKTKSHQIFSQDADLRHEIGYLAVLFTAGQFLDSKHIHRVHALGLSFKGKAILVLLPMGGGKSTLALQLLQSEEIKLLSEDSPLISRRGQILPFPLRIGVTPGDELNIPDRYLREFKRVDFGPKVLIDIEYFADKISSVSEPWIILLGQRSLGLGSRIEPASKLSATKEFVKNAVVGLGLHQGVEYILQTSPLEIWGKSGLALSRLRNSLKVVSRSKIYRYVIGRDRERNREVWLEFLQRTSL